MTNPAYKILIEVFEKYYPQISAGFKIKVQEKLREDHYKKGTRVLNYGQVQESLLFIYKGSAIELFVDPLTLEQTTTNFWFESNFLYTTPGLFNHEPSTSYIMLLEDTHLVGILFIDLIAFKVEFPEVELLIENIRSHYDNLRLQYLADFRFPSYDRVKKLEKLHPDIYNRLEIQHIAQYLKISVKTLSRIRDR